MLCLTSIRDSLIDKSENADVANSNIKSKGICTVADCISTSEPSRSMRPIVIIDRRNKKKVQLAELTVSMKIFYLIWGSEVLLLWLFAEAKSSFPCHSRGLND